MPFKKDNLWILTDYGMRHDWIDAISEERGIWPVLSVDNVFQRTFVCERIDAVESVIVSYLTAWGGREGVERYHTIPLDARMRLRFAVTTDTGRVCDLFPDNAELTEVDAALRRLQDRQPAFIVSAQFCSVRLDDEQHFVFAVDETMNVVWRGRTVEEDFVQTRSNEGTLGALTLHLRRSIFVFDDDVTAVSASFRGSIRLGLILAFYRRLTVDAIDCISEHVASAYRVSPKDFRRGAYESVFNYSTARLLKIGWILNESSICLHEFHRASVEEKKKVYPMLKSIYRRRHTVFDRRPASRVLRSGVLY